MYTNKQQWYQSLEESLGLEPADLDELAGILMQTLPEALSILSQATAGRDELRRQAHSVKGSAGNLGLIKLSEMADELETCILKGGAESPVYHEKIVRIQAEYQAFVALMKT